MFALWAICGLVTVFGGAMTLIIAGVVIAAKLCGCPLTVKEIIDRL